MELSARTFFVAVSAGLEVVRPSIGPINDGAFCAVAVEPRPNSSSAVVAQA
jgi:hypothetical protein